jgi:hypothetical protein
VIFAAMGSVKPWSYGSQTTQTYGMDMAGAKQGKRWKRTSKRPMELIGIWLLQMAVSRFIDRSQPQRLSWTDAATGAGHRAWQFCMIWWRAEKMERRRWTVPVMSWFASMDDQRSITRETHTKFI